MAKKYADLDRLIEIGQQRFGTGHGWKRRFAEALGISDQNMNNILAGRVPVGPKTRERVREVFNIDLAAPDSGHRTEPAREYRPVTAVTGFAPFLGRVVATPEGKEYFEEEGIPQGAGIPFFPGNFFCLEVENDSMIDAEPPIYPGDYCVFELKRQPKNNDIVAVHLKDNRRLVKILKHKSSESIQLVSANRYRNFLPITLKKTDIATFGVFVTKVQIPEGEKRRFGLKT